MTTFRFDATSGWLSGILPKVGKQIPLRPRVFKDGYKGSYSSSWADNEICFCCGQRCVPQLRSSPRIAVEAYVFFDSFKEVVVFDLPEAVLNPEAIIHRCFLCQTQIQFTHHLGQFASEWTTQRRIGERCSHANFRMFLSVADFGVQQETRTFLYLPGLKQNTNLLQFLPFLVLIYERPGRIRWHSTAHQRGIRVW